MLRTRVVTVIALPNQWQFATDPEGIGVPQEWFAVDFDDSDWVQVRSEQGNGWESQGFPSYDGFGWYRQAFDLPADPGRKYIYLCFGAADEEAWIYLNGEPVLERPR